MHVGGRGRAGLVAGIVGGGALLLVASVAWACSPNAHITSNPRSGRPGASVTVTATSFMDNSGPVVVRWNATDGPELGRGPNNTASFSVNVVIPADAQSGRVYYLVGVQRSSSGAIVGRASTSFTVTAPAGTGTGTDTGESGTTSGSVNGEEPAGNEQATSSTETRQASQTRTTERASASPSGASAAIPAGSDDSAASQAGGATSEAAAAPASERQPVLAGGSTAPAPEGERSAAAVGTAPVDGGSIATAPVASAPSAPALGDETSTPSARSATSDLWGGFAEGTTDRPGLLGGGESSGSSGTAPLALGVLALSLGLVAVGGGAAVAEIGRRRATVKA